MLFSGSSVVYCMRGCCLLRWSRNESMLQVFNFAKVSSTYLFHNDGGLVNKFSAFFSNLCINSSAAKPDVDAPMAKPSICLYSLPLKMEYVFFTHILNIEKFTES